MARRVWKGGLKGSMYLPFLGEHPPPGAVTRVKLHTSKLLKPQNTLPGGIKHINLDVKWFIHNFPLKVNESTRYIKRKGGMGMSGGQDPLFTSLLPFYRSPVTTWFSSLDPTLSKNIKFWLLHEKLVKNLKNFQLCSLNLAKFQSKSPQNVENF